MDIKKYGKDIQELYQKQRAYLQKSDARLLDVLEELLHKATALRDDALLGYVYHSLAFAEFFIHNNYEGFTSNLRLANQYLLQCNEYDELMHVHYLVAIDAMNRGLFDLSYHYFMKARKLALDAEQPTSAAIIEESIGHILMVLGSYKEARSFFKTSLIGIEKDREHPHYFNNMVSCHINEALCCIGLGLIDEAKLACEKAKQFMNLHPDAFQIDARINYAFLETRIAVYLKDKEKMVKGVGECITLLEEVTQIANYDMMLYELVSELLSVKAYDLAGSIVENIGKMNLSNEALHAQRLMNEIKILYYRAIGNTEEELLCYNEQDKIYARIKVEQKDSQRYAQDLITLTADLQRDQVLAMHRKEELIHNVETDALTGLANRYMCDFKMNQIFEKAFANKGNFGIAVVDLDNLKYINDHYGHQVGDEKIIEFANALTQLMEDERIFSTRYGGDEFVLIFDQMDNEEIVAAIKKIRQFTDMRFSVGCANAIPAEKMKTWDYLKLADEELFKIKMKKKEGKRTSDYNIRSKKMTMSERKKNSEA